MTVKENVFKLRSEGKSYSEISKILNISKATISYHCKSLGIGEQINCKIDDDLIPEINLYYLNHTLDETALKFKVSRSTINKYTENKITALSDVERKRRKYLNVKTRIQTLKQLSVEYLGGKCIKCGYDKCIWALDFHHRNPEEKEFGIASYASRAWYKLKPELDKCDLLCSNCHRELHYNIEKDK